MKIACEACGAKYTIADDKVRGRKVKIRCKGCGTPIVVDGQHGGGASVSDAETDTTLETVDAPAVWSVNLTDTDSRTMSVEEIVAGYASGLVTADAFVWKDGMTDWVALLDSELAPLLQAAGPAEPAAAPAPASAPAAVPTPAVEAAPLAPFAPAPSASLPAVAPRGTTPQFGAPNLGSAPTAAGSRPTAARPAAARVQALPSNTQDLFGGIDAAGSDDEVATSAPTVPQAGSSAYDDGKMTGARNENSVLFSLDALKAGFSPSAPPPNAKPVPKAPKGPSQRPQQPSNPDDPFGMGATAGIGGLSGGALFGADNSALLTAPPPPPPPPPAQVASGVPGYAAPPQKNKLVLIVGGIGGLVIIGLLAALLFGKKHEAEPGTDGSALASANSAPEKAPEAKKEEEPAPKAEDKPAESASAAAPSASAAASAAPTAKPVAVAVKSDAAKKPKEDAPPPADAPPFSKASAISALSAAAASAGSCKKPGGPTGGGKATVTFAPSGRVTTATVAGGSFAGTPVGGCIASVFRRAHVPAFSGSSVTVSKSFSVN